MRDQKRIFAFCNRLASTWAAYVPDLRFGQLISNLFQTMGKDPFYVEDDEMIQIIESYHTPRTQNEECRKYGKASNKTIPAPHEVLDGLYAIIGRMLFDPSTGESKKPGELIEDDRKAYDACVGAIQLLKAKEANDHDFCHG